jgi:hypothetical protein
MQLIVNFVAENIGPTAASHFDFSNEIFFKGQRESGVALGARIEAKLEEWKTEYSAAAADVLLPKDTQVDVFLDTPEVDWWTGLTGQKLAQPVFVAAVFYRTSEKPDLIQFSWRSWYLSHDSSSAELTTFIPQGAGDLGPDELAIRPFHTTLTHSEYSAGKRD